MKSTSQLNKIASSIRQDIISMLLKAGSGHSAGSLGMADVFCALYFGGVLNINPKKPKDPKRDRLVLSAGHICPAWYASLARAGFFPRSELWTLRKIGSRLQGHPHQSSQGSLPGVENSSGPLGQGLSVACGLAYAALMDSEKYQVYCVMSDGEQQEGQIWEAAMFAAKYRLANLTAIIDRNNIQISGFTEDVMPLEPLVEKYRSFGWQVMEVDGHNIQAVIDACQEAKAIYGKPVVIIAHTIPGKGVDFMERDYKWHGRVPQTRQAKKAIAELRTLKGKIESEHQ